jgi:hypothetical protein
VQHIPPELLAVIADRLKLGDLAKPVCRVEVDRLAFIPGRTEHLKFVTSMATPAKTITLATIDGDGLTSNSPLSIVFPAVGYSLNNMSSPFGPRWGKMHKGVDIACPIGTDVVAVWSGTVVKCDHNGAGSAGKNVSISHGEGFLTRYLHLSSIKVTVGDVINQGAIIALSGNTGHSTGPHLHFEIRTGYDSNKEGTAIDPRPYLSGDKARYGASTSAGTGVVTVGTVTGTPAEVILNETFNWRMWSKAPAFTVDSNFDKYSYVIQSYNNVVPDGYHRISLPKGGAITTGFNISTKLSQNGYLDFGFSSTFDGALDDLLTIYVNTEKVINVKSFQGSGKYEEIKGVYIPEGTSTIRIVFTGGGQHDAHINLDYLKITELSSAPVWAQKSEAELDPTIRVTPASQDLANLMSGIVDQDVYLQVGQFVYMDTLVLDNVMSCDTDEDYEMAAGQAKVTVTNPKGWYSPDYNPYLFPEIGTASPYSYYINGFHVGVLSENTPIRIYMGYGMNDIRMFTGLIDKVDIDGEATMSITCRSMYKRLLEKVMTEKKAYPDVYQNTGSADLPSNLSSLPLTEQIVAQAKVEAAKFSVDYKFLVAIAKHETSLGTTGLGRPEKGSYILGYGCPSNSNPDETYKGIPRQLYYGAKRMSEALASKGKQVLTKPDVLYFHDGGDKGNAFTWSADRTNWVDDVWSIYSDYVANPGQLDNLTSPTPSDIALNTDSSGAQSPAWWKSAVVQDLLNEAGMYGWRATAEDLLYPDAVIEETVLIEVNQKQGFAIKAVPNLPYAFEEVPIQSIPTPQGWLNPFIDDYGRTFGAYKYKVSDAVDEVMKDTGYRYYCDRFGTFRLEKIKFTNPIVAYFHEADNLVSLTKTVDWSRGRSHVVIIDSDGKVENFIDKEILMELKGEVRTGVVEVAWAKSYAQKKQVAERIFFDMKRTCRTLQVAIPMNPALDVLDRVMVTHLTSTTRAVYIIKSIKTNYSVAGGAVQVIDLMWAMEGMVV